MHPEELERAKIAVEYGVQHSGTLKDLIDYMEQAVSLLKEQLPKPKQEIVIEERHRFPGAGVSMFGAS